MTIVLEPVNGGKLPVYEVEEFQFNPDSTFTIKVKGKRMTFPKNRLRTIIADD